MKSIYQLICLLVLFLFINTIAYAIDYYVDNTVASSGNGQSWATAWKNFSNINWSSIQPGDVIYISGGTDSTIYYEQLTVGKSGTAGYPITIISGKYSPSPSGHKGRVIIDGGGTRSQSIYVQNKNYITLKGFECRHATKGIHVEDNASYIIIDSMYIYNFRDQAGIMLNGASNYTIDYTTIRNCRIVSYQLYNGQTDGIYAQRCQRTLVHDNYIRVRNQDPNAHNDALQAYLTNGWVIYNNFFINDSVYSPEGGGTPIILGSQGTNPVIIYNNFLYMGGIWYPSGNQNSALWTRWYNNNPMPPTWVIHNTIVVNGPRCRNFIQEYGAITINNILATFSTSEGMANLEESLPTSIPVDSTRNNLLWRSWSGPGFSGQFTGNGHTGTPSGWTSWINTYGGTGVNTDPLFFHKFGYEPDQGALNGELQAGSPAIGIGEDAEWYINYLNATYNLQGDWALQWKDINGYPRDNTPTIGAFESSSVPVELISFTANISEKGILLNWSTATEINNSGFEIQKLQDYKIERLKDWETIGFVPGHGTTTEPKLYSYTDYDISSGTYTYRLKQIDFDGTYEYSNEIEVEVDFTPKEYMLKQNYPNPFNPSTRISWQSPINSWQTLKIYDVLGNEIATLVDEYKQAGIYEVEWNTSDLPSGIYFYQMKIEGFVETRKMNLIK